MKTTEVSLGEVVTRQFIDENPIEVVFTRRTKTPTASGGYTWTNPQQIQPQRVRKVIPDRQAATQGIRRVTEDGTVIVPSALLIGMIDLDVQRFDLATIDGKIHEVVFVTRRPIFQRTVVEVVQYG